MLRLVVLLLVLANALYFTWSRGYLSAYGWGPASQSEPQRLAQQIRPEALRVASASDPRATNEPLAASASAAATQAEPAAECLQAGVFTAAQGESLSAVLSAALPAGSWALESAVEPARWIVYMGRYASAEAAVKKQGELRGLGVASELIKRGPSGRGLAPGLSLSAFETEEEATAGLALVSKRGVKTAGIRQERAELRGQRLKLPAVDAALRSQLEAIKPPLAGKPLQACAA